MTKTRTIKAASKTAALARLANGKVDHSADNAAFFAEQRAAAKGKRSTKPSAAALGALASLEAEMAEALVEAGKVPTKARKAAKAAKAPKAPRISTVPQPIADARSAEMRLNRAARAFECPQCASEVGKPCMSEAGKLFSWRTHAVRRAMAT